MGFIKCIFGKVNHIIINLVCHFLIDSSCNTARNIFFRITIDKVLPLLLHYLALFLRHGTAHQVRSAPCITGEVTYNLHNLFLIYDTAIGRRQNRLQFRAVIGNAFRVVFSLDISRNKVHWTRTVKRNACDNIL